MRQILVIDDDTFTCALITKCLQGYGVQVEHDGLSGLRAAQRIVPDLIVCDFLMPKLDGLTLCKLLRMDARTRSVPVIMLSAIAENEYRQQALQTGANALVSKSLMQKELRAKVEALLGEKPAES